MKTLGRCFSKPRNAKIVCKPSEARRKAWNRWSLAASCGTNPAVTLIPDFLAPEPWDTMLHCLGHVVFATLANYSTPLDPSWGFGVQEAFASRNPCPWYSFPTPYQILKHPGSSNSFQHLSKSSFLPPLGTWHLMPPRSSRKKTSSQAL